MASGDQIASLRLLVDEPEETYYTDQALSDRIDGAVGNLDAVAYEVWIEKAARWAALANVSEGGSSRSMDSLHAKALQMVELFRRKLAAVQDADIGDRRVRISRLRR